MKQPLWIRAYRLAAALLAIVAVLRKYDRDGDAFVNWLSKFTIESNVLAAVVLLGGAILPVTVLTSRGWDRARGAAVMYMATTFVVYGLLIDGFDNPLTTSRHWTHTVLHQVIPIVIVLDLLIRPLVHRLTWRDALRWCVYPIIYLIYSLVRGAITGWYPYTFIDPGRAGGYGGVARYSLGITIGFLVLAFLIVWLSNLRERPPDKVQTRPMLPASHHGRHRVPRT